MLRAVHPFNVLGRGEITQILVGMTDAVIARTRRVLDVGHTPCAVTHQLEGRCTLALLISFEIDIIISYRLRPWTGQFLAGRGEDTRCASLFLYHHMKEPVRGQIVDVGINGGIAPIEEQLGLGQTSERLVGIGIVHAVVLLFGAVPHGVVNHIAALLAIRPLVVAVPNDLGSPHTVDGTPILIYIGRLWVAEDGSPLTVVEGNRLPMDEVIRGEEVNTVVVPLGSLLQFLVTAYTHVGGHHQVALSIVAAGDVGIALSAFDAGMFLAIHDGIAIDKVVEMKAITTESVCRPLTASAHVAIEVAIIARLIIARMVFGVPGRVLVEHTLHIGTNPTVPHTTLATDVGIVVVFLPISVTEVRLLGLEVVVACPQERCIGIGHQTAIPFAFGISVHLVTITLDGMIAQPFHCTLHSIHHRG